jgi:NADPH:quinone reductase-like Zn-dependent oxidoreductase
MKAVRIHSFGDPEVLHLEEVDTPKPQPGEVLVKVGAAGINPVDYKIRQGKYPKITAAQLPIILGRDVCGTIEQTAADGSGLRSGDEIYALLDWSLGGYAQYVALPASLCVARPRNLSVVECGAVPLAALTAWQGLFDHAGLETGQSVLIHAGAGGVGHFAVQFAKHRGARVMTTVSAENLQFVLGLGADVAIDYEKQRFEEIARDIDVVYDLVGGDTRERSWNVLRPGGILVSTLGQPDEREASKRRVRATGYMAQPDQAQLAEIGRLLEDGKVRPTVTKTFALEEASRAHRYLEKEHPRGKIAFSIN